MGKNEITSHKTCTIIYLSKLSAHLNDNAEQELLIEPSSYVHFRQQNRRTTPRRTLNPVKIPEYEITWPDKTALMKITNIQLISFHIHKIKFNVR